MLRKVLLGILYIVFIFFLIGLFNLNIFNTLYFVIISFVLLLILFFDTFMLLRGNSSKLIRNIFIIISVLLIMLFVVGNIYLNSTINFIKNNTSTSNNSLDYSVIVLKKSKYKKINDLDGLKIGFIEKDVFLDNSVNSLKNSSNISFDKELCKDIDSLMKSLLNSQVNGISVDSSYLDLLEDSDYKYFNDIKIIYSYNVKRNKLENKSNKLYINKPFVLYLSGSDSRRGLNARGRSDVNMLVVVNPNKHKILLVSIPRDYYVQLHGTSGNRDKLTHAGIYGIDMCIGTIEDLLDVNIDKYVKVSFSTVINVVDVIDGIDIYSDKSFTAWTNRKCSYVRGIQHVDGKCALAFVRERKAYDTGDRHRGENQEQVIGKILDKISNYKYLVKYNDILKSIDGSFVTNVSYDEITSFVKMQLSNLSSWDVDVYNLDGYDSSGYTYSMPAWYLYVMEPNMNTVNSAKSKISEYLEK